MRISEAERLFNEEVREKKRAGIGVFSRASRRGYVGKMFFPYELASRKEKSKHKRAGKVMTTNLFDKILPAAEFDQLEEYEQRNRMAYWRNTYTTNEIKKEMGTSGTKFYALLEKLGIPKDGQKTSARKGAVTKKTKVEGSKEKDLAKKAAKALAAMKPPAKVETPAEVPAAPQEPKEAPPQLLILKGLNIAYNGDYTSDEIRRLLKKLDILLEGEPDRFQIELKIMQR